VRPGRVAILTLGIVLSSSLLVAKRPLIDDDFLDMSRAIGFVLSQTYSLEQLPVKFPALAASCEVAKREFNVSFGLSLMAMEKLLQARSGVDWADVKRKMATAVREKFHPETVSESEARDFTALVRERAQGKLVEERILQTLLMWDPAHRRQPAEEIRKYKTKFIKGSRYSSPTPPVGHHSMASAPTLSASSPVNRAVASKASYSL
jgi:hypothetical protein